MGGKSLGALSALVLVVSIVPAAERIALVREPAAPPTTDAPRIVEYFIAADEVAWDYAPTGMNQITGAPFDEEANVFVENGPHRIAREGPVPRVHRRDVHDARAGAARVAAPGHPRAADPRRGRRHDPRRVQEIKNNTQFPFSMHPHGVFYDKDSEGAPYNDGTSGPDTDDDAVPPGGMHTYVWPVPDRAGPGPNDPSSILWMYHSHVDEPKDTNAGLIGPMIITRRGMGRTDDTPRDVDREFITMFVVFDENSSWYLDQNIASYAGDPEGVDPEDEEFEESNLMHGINGFVFGNLPMLTMRRGERVRWYLLGMGTEVDLHTPHWHGATVLFMGMRTDVVELLPASMKIADMVPDNNGTWLYHCHVTDHISAGMLGRFQVVP